MKPVSAEHRCEFWVGQHRIQLLLNAGGIADVVGVLNRVKLTLHHIERPVECYRPGSVRLAENANPAVVQEEVRYCVETAISAAVIDNYNIQVTIRLVYYAQNGRSQIFARVVNACHN